VRRGLDLHVSACFSSCDILSCTFPPQLESAVLISFIIALCNLQASPCGPSSASPSLPSALELQTAVAQLLPLKVFGLPNKAWGCSVQVIPHAATTGTPALPARPHSGAKPGADSRPGTGAAAAPASLGGHFFSASATATLRKPQAQALRQLPPRQPGCSVQGDSGSHAAPRAGTSPEELAVRRAARKARWPAASALAAKHAEAAAAASRAALSRERAPLRLVLARPAPPGAAAAKFMPLPKKGAGSVPCAFKGQRKA